MGRHSMDTSGHERKAEEDFEKAEKKAAKRSWFGGTGNKEEAAELFSKSATAFKIAQKFDRAGAAFKRCAEIHHILGNKLDEQTNYVEAGNAYKMCSPADAVAMLSAAAEMCMDANRLGSAAKHFRDIGEIYEKSFEFQKSSQAYSQAYNFFKMEGQQSNANACNLKVAAFSAQHLNDYDAAIKIFETIGKEACGNHLLKYSAKKHFFHAGLCRLASAAPIEVSQDAINAYKDYDVTFPKQRECDFLLEACGAIANADADRFTAKITDYDSISTLDAWTTCICLRIKKAIQANSVMDLNDIPVEGEAKPPVVDLGADVDLN